MKIRCIPLGLICATWLAAQQAPLFPTLSYFRKQFSTPTGRVELQPPVRLSDYFVEGKLELSLRAFLDLVMANNTDIAVQKLSVETSSNNILREFGAFDPILNATFSATRASSPASDQLVGAATSKTLSQPAQFTYTQRLFTGTQFNVGFSGQKSTTNAQFSTFNPALSSTFSFGFAQPLMRGRGAYITRMPITIARANLRSTELNFTDQVTSLIQNAENAYWDLVAARETLKVQEAALANSEVSLKRSQRELELGALPPLDIFQPQADYATAQIQVSQAQFRLAQLEDALRKQIGADLDPKVRSLPVSLTETVLPPTEASSFDKEALVQTAIDKRPDLEAGRVGLETDDLSIRRTADLLRPDFSLTGSYQSTGRGGNQYQRSGLGTDVTAVIPGGFSDALSQVFGFNYPTYRLGVTLRLPIRDRTNNADLANALIKKKQDALSQRSREQAVRLSVLNAISQVESSRESVKLAIVARDLAKNQLDAEWKKYNLGTSQMFYVLDAQTRLTNAESRVVTESINYRRNQLSLLRATGTLLEERGIAVQ